MTNTLTWKSVLVFSFILISAISGYSVEITDAIKQAVFEKYSLDTASYQIEITSNRIKLATAESVEISFRAFSSKEPRGPFNIYVKIERNGKIIDKGQVRLIIRKFADVLIVSDRVKRHQILSTANFEIKRVEITSLREQPVYTFDSVDDKRSKKNLRIGDILTTGSIEPIPDIEVGGEVSIIFSDHWGSVTAPGKVLQSGSSGDLIRVKNKATGKIVNARVVNSMTVAVGPVHTSKQGS